jgi:zinc transport system permease protein
MSSFGFAVGILLVSLSSGMNVDLFAYLFGDILTISSLEVKISLALAVAVVLVIIFYFRNFLFTTFDPEAAQVAGIPEKRVEYLLTVLAGITVVLGMKVVGLLLVVALMVIPAASALRIARNFRQALVFAGIFSLSEIFVGLCLSFLLDIPAAAGIVLLGFGIYLIILFSQSRFRQRS